MADAYISKEQTPVPVYQRLDEQPEPQSISDLTIWKSVWNRVFLKSTQVYARCELIDSALC